MGLGIDINSSYSDIVNNIEVLRQQYEGLLTSFSCFELKKRNYCMWEVKREIYSLKLLEWKKDLIWQYLNGLQDISALTKNK